MAKNQKIINKSSDQLFHKIGESKLKDGVTPPMLNTVMKGDGLGVPMTDVSSPTKILPAVLAVGARFALGRLAKYAVKKGVQRSMKGLIKNKAGRIISEGSKKFASPGSTGIMGKIGKGLGYLTGTSRTGKAISYGTAATLPSMFSSGSDSSSMMEQGQDMINKGLNTGKKITGALGSELRRQQYDAKGWKHDHTISGDHEGSFNSKPKSVKPTKVKTSTTSTSSKPIEKQPTLNTQQSIGGDANVIKSRKQQKKEKLTNKANIAAASGNYNKANRLNKRANRQAPNVVNMDVDANYSANLQGSGKTFAGKALKTVGDGVKSAGNAVGGAVNNIINNKDKDSGTPFKRSGCGPRGLGASKR